MTKDEFNYQFEALYNNVTSNKAPGLNTYEKSVFLTKAQDELIKNYFRPQGNPKQEGYLSSPKREYDFHSLIDNTSQSQSVGTSLYHKDGRDFGYPSDALLILNEQVLVKYNEEEEGTYLIVTPLTFAEYNRLMAKPFKYPPKGQVWKLNVSTSRNNETSPMVELITYSSKPFTTFNYQVRYVRKPYPIILSDDLSTDFNVEGLTIHGKSGWRNLDTPEEMHEEILQRAVELAKAAWQGDMQSSVQLGERSE